MNGLAFFTKGVYKRGGLLLLLFRTVLFTSGQTPEMKYLGIENGLSNNSVRCIYQDHSGFMWFGTYDGLNRYDGYAFTTFRNKLDDPASLPHNYINVIKEDRNNNLWVGTGQGIGIYNRLSTKWQVASCFRYGKAVKEKITANINDIETDEAGNVFIGTNDYGLLVQDKKADAARQLPCKKGEREVTEYNVQAVRKDAKGRVWVFVEDVGLGVYDIASQKIRFVNHSLKSIRCLAINDAAHLWLGTKNGLFQYDIPTNTFAAYPTKEPAKLASLNINSLYLDKQRNLWIGTEGSGVNIVNTATGDVSSLLPGDDKKNITSESVNAVYEDRESRKWIGTLKGGLNIIDPEKTRFQTVAHDQRNPNSLINNFVYSFYEDKERNLWVGTDGGGFSIWNRRENKFTNFRHDEHRAHSLSNNSVTAILQDYLNNTWISTYGGGINKFNRTTGLFEPFPCINEKTGEESKIVTLLYEDRDKNLWAGTFSGGRLYRFNRNSNRFEVFDQRLSNLLSITEDRNGNLWAGNPSQLIKIDKLDGRHVAYELGKPVRAIYEDKKGNFWVGTEGGGLILFNREQGKIALRFSVENGLCNNSILKILEDDKGQLWLSTFNGLSRYNPGDKTFRNYYQSDGLQSNQFLFRAGLRLSSGEFVFGGIRGFDLFYPDSIQLRNSMPPVVLTSLRINSKPVADNYNYVVQTSSDQISALRIPYDEAVLSFEFAALEYSTPNKIAYAYYLEGWDKTWTYAGTLRTASYTHLSEGHYVLHIKSTNAAGSWNPKELVLKIRVLPPWYRTWWAYAFYLLSIAAAISVYLQYRAKQARLEYEVLIGKLNAEKERVELEKERADREKAQAEVEREKAERETERVINEREKEINEKRLSFFTDVSHEFRTPLTLIINPIKDLLNRNGEDGEEKKELTIVYRNARRLLSLVDQLLLFRKADTEADELAIARLDLVAVCHDVYLSFLQLAKAKKISYEFEAPGQRVEVFADKEKVEIVLFNLLSNALKYTQAGGNVLFRVKESDEVVEVFVADNGPGIPTEVGDKLFDRFYRIPSPESKAKTGFGIGLYLARHFMEKHKGAIGYESEEGKGTRFCLTFLKGANHLDRSAFREEKTTSSDILQELVEEPVLKEEKSGLENLVTERRSILLVDDDDQLRQYMVQLFQENYVIYEAKSGEEGLALAAQNTPDLIISDVSMTGMSGIELTKQIKETQELSHIPVVLLTGASAQDTQLKGVKSGADDYMTKPFEKAFLQAKVETILRNRNVLQNYFYNEITLQKNTLKVSPEYKEFLHDCIRIVENHLDDEQFSIQTLAAEIGMSHSSLYKRVKSISGQSVNAFIRFIRLRKAAELFITTDSNINQVSMEVGINDIKYFRSQFNKLFGMNPSEYIRKFRKPFNKNFTLSEKLVRQKKE